MKKLLLISLIVVSAVCSHGQAPTGDEILAFVRSKLPNEPLRLSGSLKVKAKNGFTKATLPVVMDLDWGASTPTATYTIGTESLTITWHNDKPSYAFSNPANTPTSSVLGTGISWADLSFSVLWWPEAKLIDEAKKINRECYVVDVPVPGANNTMRLWLEKSMGMLLEAQTLDARKQELSRLKIVSIKNMEGMWVAKDLELRDRETGTKTTLQISNLEWINGAPAAAQPDQGKISAFDPAESVNALAFDLFRALAEDNADNLFFSPYSISSALAMTYAGARGETAEQMDAALYFGGPQATHAAFAYLRRTLLNTAEKRPVQFSVANALWPQKDYLFRPDYLALTREFYASEIHPVDYRTAAEEARREINTWVEEQTGEKIRDIIAEGALAPSTRLVLVNAIYFKGDWAAQFKKEATIPAPFRLTNGQKVQVPMMAQTDDFNLAYTDTFQALELPYEGGELSMIIVLPNTGESPELEALNGLEFRKTEVAVKLPGFRLESAFNLGRVLRRLGMPLAFSRQADFSGMDGSRDLFIDEVLHKAYVEVNEEGTEAAAATAATIRVTSMPMPFIVDRPFLFLIRDNTTGTILFMGRVMDPST